MSIESIYNDIHAEWITLGPHLIQRIWENDLSIDQVLDTILTGTINKQEKDERSQGKFSKFTISKGEDHCCGQRLPTSIHSYCKQEAVTVQCPNGCSESMGERKEEKIFHRNGEPVVVSELTMCVCPHCGCESMPLSSAKIVEDILNEKIQPSGKFTAELYEISSIG